MSDDILDLATRALRESNTSHDVAARFTRARVMATLHQQRRSRGRRLAVLIPLAAILVGSTAFAGVTGRLPAAVFAVAEVMGVSFQPAPAPVETPVVRAPAQPRSTPAAEVEPGDHDGEPILEESAPEVPSVAPSAVPAPAAAAPPAPSASARRLDPEGPEAQAAYRQAHAAHFQAHDWGRALAAWDEYLRLAPRGRFALEASYNRALCLIRLGRTGEALTALEPFAAGRYGGYRQREASELVVALGGTVPSPVAPAPAPTVGEPAQD